VIKKSGYCYCSKFFPLVVLVLTPPNDMPTLRWLEIVTFQVLAKTKLLKRYSTKLQLAQNGVVAVFIVLLLMNFSFPSIHCNPCPFTLLFRFFSLQHYYLLIA
jgi:hypothetical protein